MTTTALLDSPTEPQLQSPPCPHFGPCGGCQLQNLTYEAQLEQKRNRLADLLRGANLTLPEIQLHPRRESHASGDPAPSVAAARLPQSRPLHPCGIPQRASRRLHLRRPRRRCDAARRAGSARRSRRDTARPSASRRAVRVPADHAVSDLSGHPLESHRSLPRRGQLAIHHLD